MSMAEFWNESWTAVLMNHLWQSTGFVGVAWLLARVLREYGAMIPILPSGKHFKTYWALTV
jgi:hypothetical protein